MGWLPLRVCVQPQWVHSSCGTFKGIEAKYYDRRCLKINGYLILSQTWYLLGVKKNSSHACKTESWFREHPCPFHEREVPHSGPKLSEWATLQNL